MTAPHTSDLDHELAAALHHADRVHADEVCFAVTGRAEDGTPTLYAVTVYRDWHSFTAEGADKTVALATAMTGLRAAMGGA
jgi:hypothetical protein